ncbi:hypothetical protein VTN96DRAFT_8981 [Rasamsonia emersonii]
MVASSRTIRRTWHGDSRRAVRCTTFTEDTAGSSPPSQPAERTTPRHSSLRREGRYCSIEYCRSIEQRIIAALRISPLQSAVIYCSSHINLNTRSGLVGLHATHRSNSSSPSGLLGSSAAPQPQQRVQRLHARSPGEAGSLGRWRRFRPSLSSPPLCLAAHGSPQGPPCLLSGGSGPKFSPSIL